MRIASPVIIFFLLMIMLNLIMGVLITKGFRTPPYQEHAVGKQVDIPKETVRKVTAYNVGDPRQTHSKPCIGAGGDNLCTLVEKGVRVCAANFVPLGSTLRVDKVGRCIVLDRMNSRFRNGVDLAMKRGNHNLAAKFGVQRLNVANVDGK